MATILTEAGRITRLYSCRGSVRGTCPHKHRTLLGAARCIHQDKVGCRRQGGYSDRTIYSMDICANTGHMTAWELLGWSEARRADLMLERMEG